MHAIAGSVVLTKIRPPQVSAAVVARVSLELRLDAALEQPISLVTAPAGFGKTWLVSDWLDTHPDTAQAWISIDRYDNDPMRLWLHVIEAVSRSACPKATDETLRLLESPSAGLTSIVDALAAGIAACGEDLILVFDDAHLLADTEALASLDHFLGLLPRNGHVLLVGRHDPDLPLAKWRLSGDLLEIRTADLRCSLEESKAIVQESLGLELDSAIIAEIQHKTMGWLAGIRLAAIATAASDDASRAVARLPAVGTVDGAYGSISDYLVEETLDDLDPDDRRFLLDTSILDDLVGPLCAAMTGQADSAGVLERLARSGLFISRTGEHSDWFRYHDLFRDALRSLLHRQSPQREENLHLKAADWLYANGSAIPAIRHAIKGGNPELAAEWLIESSRSMLEAKQFDTMCALFARVDDIWDAPTAIFLATWCFPVLFCSSGTPYIDSTHERASHRLQVLTPAEDRLLRDEWLKLPEPFESSAELLLGIDATLAHRSGDVDLAQHALQRLGDTVSASGWVEAAAGETLIFRGRYTEGLELMQPWADFSFSSRNPVLGNTAYTLTTQAWAKIGRGNLAQAELLANQAIETLHANRLGDQPQAAIATVPLAWVAHEVGEVELAERLVTPVLDRVGHYGEVPAYVFAQVLLARIYHSQGNSAEAHMALDQAALLPSGRPVTGHFADYITFERCRLALLNNDVAAAQLALPDWQQRIHNGATTMTEHLMLTRLTIATGNDPTKLLETTPDRVDVTSTHQVELHKLNAYNALHNGDETVALDHLTNAMKIAIHTGHRQTFLDDYPTFGTLIENAAAMAGHHLVRTDRQPQPQVDVGKAARLVDPLTERELEVLGLLPTHLTYREIGEQINVSTNTVKSYLKNIYRKLEADSRNEAVTKARALGLVS